MDPESYQRIRDPFDRATEADYGGAFDEFAINHLETDTIVTVAGEPVDLLDS